MRFTVKAKLASAFGIVILLSMIAGGVAYMKLNDMVVTAEHLSARAGRLAKVGELQEAVLLQVRAEKNTILARRCRSGQVYRPDRPAPRARPEGEGRGPRERERDRQENDRDVR